MLLAAAFGVLAVGATLAPRLPGDLELTRAVRRALPLAGMPLLEVVAWLGELPVAIALTLTLAAFLWFSSGRAPALLVLLTLLPDPLNYLMKGAIGRPRPDPDLLFLEPSAVVTGLSFPSGHVVHFVVFFGLLALVLPSWRAMSPPAVWMLRLSCLALILLAGLGRIALGAHWPSDVLGGYLLGLLCLRGLLTLNAHVAVKW